ncbi:MAG TPA: SDR family NAD(P)-dependent oxidoreductase [Chthonomonas sp.]|uniref:SDR family NAD(P)-dependent oxidoreductase n=1 Tax=Chthonomonas sp. TaxID=2282153 RepID=UPI002B4B7CC4|nr:SDR family NAD(P)-dependent oxidoreductase [Chthonomonas sp.]HLI49483.1 SDR family NAD(P)-dependent oxidoreductase [Chthonomonas sp.]
MQQSWQRAVIIGASSGIGEALARKLASEGCLVAMVARRLEKLEQIAEEIAASGAPKPLLYRHDVCEVECVPALFQQITYELGGLDLIIYSAGIMPILAEHEYSLEKDLATIDVNVRGAVAWLDVAAERFERAGSGTLIGISSVAGDRGRRHFPVYSASKAFLDTYLEGLRNRTGRYGVRVVTIKPGPVDTPLVKGLKNLPFLISADKAAELILKGARRDGVVYVPRIWRPIMAIVRLIPSFIFKRLNV